MFERLGTFWSWTTLLMTVATAVNTSAAPVDGPPINDFGAPDKTRSISGLIEDSSGNPLPSVRLFIDGHGEVATGRDGRFVVEGLAKGIIYGFTAQRTGVEFNQPFLVGQVGDFLKLKASSNPFVPPAGCTERERARQLAIASQAANRLRVNTIVMARRIPAHQQMKLLNGEVITAGHLPERVEQQYSNYAALSKQLPEFEYSCVSEDSCKQEDLRAIKLFMSLELDNLSHERLLTTRILVRRGVVPKAQKAPLRRTILSLRRRGRAAIDVFRNYASFCAAE
jgi:hypothetical protein